MNSNWTYAQAQRWARKFLKASGQDPAAAQFVLRMFHNWSPATLLAWNREPMPEIEVHRYQQAMRRVANHEPPQYVVGKAPFFGRCFVVNRQVLIPESETEELVEWILATAPADRPLTVLDLGTGSGVIGITLALERPRWQITLSDISPAALEVAMHNQRLHGTNLRQVESDLFTELVGERFDLIVTNPPYVGLNELSEVDQAVLAYEPPQALLAGTDGLDFYRHLLAVLKNHWTLGGQFFGETGWHQEESLRHLFQTQLPSVKIQTKHDVADRMRMIWALNCAGLGEGKSDHDDTHFSVR